MDQPCPNDFAFGQADIVNENALQAERFIDKWLDIAKKNPPQPRGDSAFQMWWKNKNAELGKDRRIALVKF